MLLLFQTFLKTCPALSLEQRLACFLGLAVIFTSWNGYAYCVFIDILQSPNSWKLGLSFYTITVSFKIKSLFQTNLENDVIKSDGVCSHTWLFLYVELDDFTS